VSGQVVGAGVERLGVEMEVGIVTVALTVIIQISDLFVVLEAKVWM